LSIIDVSKAEAFKKADATSYDSVATAFESLAQQFTRPIANRLLDLARIDSGMKVLDVGCGTGILTRLAAARLTEAGQAVGIDLSEGVLQKGRELAAAEGLHNRVAFRSGDAEELPFEDRSFDVVISLYALRHLPDPVRALRAMKRVLVPGGRAVVAVGSAAPVGSVAYIRTGCRLLWERLQIARGRGPLYATTFLEGMLDSYLGQARREEEAKWTHGTDAFSSSVANMMGEAGFADVETEWVGQTSYIDSAEDFWTLQATLSSRARKRLVDAREQDVARLKEAFKDTCISHLARGGTLVYRSGASITVGRVREVDDGSQRGTSTTE
jgi:ubiquinone/menaquinone biosynthesis C-methylase UbiE